MISGSIVSGGKLVSAPVQYKVRIGLVGTMCGVIVIDDITIIVLHIPQRIVGPKYSSFIPCSITTEVVHLVHLYSFSISNTSLLFLL